MSAIRPALFIILGITLAACSGDKPSSLLSGGALKDADNGTTSLETASVTGNAIIQVFAPTGFGQRRLTVDAHAYADGSVTGEWNLVAGATILHGDVDCLTILPDGRTARLSGIVTSAKFTTYLPGTAFALEVVDNGEGLADEPDQTSALSPFQNVDPEVGRVFCETGEAPQAIGLLPVIKGNIQVHVN